jgi:hypothetical protein
LLALRARLDSIGWVADRRSFVALLPAPDGGGADFYGVLGGRLAVEMRLGATSDLWVAVLRVRDVWERFHETRPARADVEGMTVVAGWLRDRSREGILLPLERVEDMERQLDQLTVTMRDLRQRGPLPEIDTLS